MSDFKKWRVSWEPTVKSTVCWQRSEDEAVAYVKAMLAHRGLGFGEIWAVEEPELWGHVFDEPDVEGLVTDG